MKTTKLCQRIEYVFASEVRYFIHPDIIALNDGAVFRTLVAQGDSEYSKDTTTDESGTLQEESLSMSVEYDRKDELMQNPYRHLVLKVHTNEGWFLMGDTLYPVTVELSHDLRLCSLEFKCSSPFTPHR